MATVTVKLKAVQRPGNRRVTGKLTWHGDADDVEGVIERARDSHEMVMSLQRQHHPGMPLMSFDEFLQMSVSGAATLIPLLNSGEADEHALVLLAYLFTLKAPVEGGRTYGDFIGAGHDFAFDLAIEPSSEGREKVSLKALPGGTHA